MFGSSLPDAHRLGDRAGAGAGHADPAADRRALVRQRRHRHPPALADVTDPVGVGDAHVGEVHLVELGLAGDLAQRSDLDARGVHVEGEVGQALVLGDVGVGAGHEHAAIGEVRVGVPHLLAVDDPLVAVALGPTGESGQVRAGAGLAEELAPGVLAGEHAPQQAAAQCVVPVGDDRGPGHREPEEVLGPEGLGAGLGERAVDVLLEPRREVESAPALGEVDPRQSEVELLAAHLFWGGGGRVDLVEELGDPLLHLCCAVCCHGRPPIRRRQTTPFRWEDGVVA